MIQLTQSSRIQLSRLTSLGVGGEAVVYETTSSEQLQEILASLDTNVKPWILGFGTNCLVSDKGLEGAVITSRGGKIIVDHSAATITADGGVWWDDVVVKAIAHNLWGIELMSGIPGSVAGGVVGNIAAYGQKIADTFVSATVFDLATKTIKTLDGADMKFVYRSSNEQHNYPRTTVLLSTTFQLSQTPAVELTYESALKVARELNIQPDSLSNRRKIILASRLRAGSIYEKNNHHQTKTAGSFFKNPVVEPAQLEYLAGFEEHSNSLQAILAQNKVHSDNSARVSAAHILLAAGFARGQSWGPVRLHPDHILKLENTGNATAQQIYDVSREIINTVKNKLDITLEPEVRFLGDFT